MRIFVSSSFEDLREHRAAAIRVLRQLGHEVLAMEDLIAASAAPLAKVLEMVDRSEAYVGIFAWRYGYVPGKTPDLSAAPTISAAPTALATPAPASPPVSSLPATPAAAPTPAPAPAPQTNLPAVVGAKYGQTSITHYEYLRAVQRKLPIMAFLLDEQYPWPPQLVDGFDTTRQQAPANANEIRALRQKLQLERVVSWFTTPTDLEARVSAAVTVAGLTNQLDLQPATALDPMTGTAEDSSAEYGIEQAIINAEDRKRALKINLSTTWWSTRLYLIAALAERLTQVRRILIVDSGMAATQGGGAPPSLEERFVGQLSIGAILSTIESRVPALGEFQKKLKERGVGFSDVKAEIHALLNLWREAFGDPPGLHTNETSCKVDLTPELLRRWFGDLMLQQPVKITDLQRASVVDLLRLLDYPNDYVPVMTRYVQTGEGGPAAERVDVMDKSALNARLARSYLVELMDRARIV